MSNISFFIINYDIIKWVMVMKTAIKDLKASVAKGFWVLLLLLGFEAFTFNKPYFIVLGIMLLLLSFLTNPFFNKITKKINICLSSKQKVFIAISNFLTAAYSITEAEKNYYRILISVSIMILFWIITIIYSNKNKIKRVTTIDNENFLRERSVDVDFERDNIKRIIKKLKLFCRQNEVYALASVQIGIKKKIIYIKNTNEDMSNNFNSKYDEEKIYINPVILSAKGNTKFLEGCASCIKDKNTFKTCVIERPYAIKLRYYNVKGEEKEEEITGFAATVFCHEYDHLNGILHIDRSKKIYNKSLKEMKEYRKNHPYKVISKTSNNNYLINLKEK